MAAKTVSQKKFAKLVASTGSLSQPPGALSRLSNLLFNQRGSLQICNGSHSIGSLPAPFLSPAWLAVFTKYASGQYPLYPTLAFPNGLLIAEPTVFTAFITSGAATNPPGVYTFVIVAKGPIIGEHSDPNLAFFRLNVGVAFPSVVFNWSVVPYATSYDVYYTDGLFPATTGNLILPGNTGNTATFTGSLTAGSTPIPQGNTSFLLQFFIGSVTPPSKIIDFVAVSAGAFPSTQPQPAQLAPGDPNFVFDTISTTPQTFVPSTINTGSVGADSSYGNPVDTNSSVVVSGFPSFSPSPGQNLVLSLNVNGGIALSLFGGNASNVQYQYSLDGGSSWVTFNSQYPTGGGGGTWNQNLTITIPSTITNLNQLQIQIVATAYPGGMAPGNTSVNGSIGATVSLATATSSSFSPYGGIPGLACVIPMEVQFAGKEILILGNGYAPQQCDPSLLSSAAPTALTNTFQAAYPTWQASVSWLTGSQISALYGSTNYLFTATQGGVSGSGTTPFTGTPPAKGSAVADGSAIWASQGPIAVPVAPHGAAHAVAYAGSLWLANTSPSTTSDGIDGPTCLKMSDSNNPNSWNPVNTAFIGRDDGSQITGLQPFTIAALGISPTGSLCVFKEFQTYQVIGVFGSAAFEIQPAQTNLGCLAARSIQFLPGFGVVRFSHLGFAVFDGINDRLISEDIRPYLFGGVDSEADLVPVDLAYAYLSQSAQTVSPPMYLCAMPLVGGAGALTRLFCYDLVMKAWAVLDLPWAISSLNAVSAGEGYPLVLAGKIDGTIQRMQSGDLNWDQGATDQSNVVWSFRTPDLFGEGSTQKLFYEQATIRGYGSASMVQSIIARLWLDGQQLGAQAVDVVPQGGSNLFEARVKIFRSGYRAHIDFSGSSGGAAGVIDAVDWAVSPKSTMARRIIS
jgi:hypothetical protein